MERQEKWLDLVLLKGVQERGVGEKRASDLVDA